MTKISLVLPIYNVEEYLEEGLNSLVNQSFDDYEIICVDDCSTDSSLEILKDFANKNDKIKVIELPENKGQGYARNIGLTSATGEYIYFFDPDDILEPNALKILYEAAKKNNAEVLQFNYYSFLDGTNKFKKVDVAKIIQKATKYNLKKEKSYCWQNIRAGCLENFSLLVWNKFFKHSFLKENNIVFSELRFLEDHAFLHKMIFAAKQIHYIDKCLYKYRIRKNSIINSVTDKKLLVFNYIGILKQHLIQLGIYNELYEIYLSYCFKWLNVAYNSIPQSAYSIYQENLVLILSPEELTKYQKYKSNQQSFLQKMFSIKNLYINAQKHKLITIFNKEFLIRRGNDKS
ncbi:MAG: glycosyltransferase family 2 protein [Candidatus Gastranaerophilales bacterium]|nr:glycosyltransferase family 2 protein [Candidatus Gastranaerophilales bacterium]